MTIRNTALEVGNLVLVIRWVVFFFVSAWIFGCLFLFRGLRLLGSFVLNSCRMGYGSCRFRIHIVIWVVLVIMSIPVVLRIALRSFRLTTFRSGFLDLLWHASPKGT